MKKRSNLTVMMRLIGLVKPLTGYMILAVLLGIIGFLCAIFITICHSHFHCCCARFSPLRGTGMQSLYCV